MKYDGVKAAEYKKFRGEYVKNRSFGEEEDEGYIIKSKYGQKFYEEIQKMNFKDDPKTKAFMDDLGYIIGKGDVYMGTFAEMMAENTEEHNN
jgi:hypothetical protein